MSKWSLKQHEAVAGKDLKILAWPAISANRYPETLYAHLPDAAVDEFRPGWSYIGKVLRERYDIFHIHWLERTFWHTARSAIIRSVIVVLVTATIVKLRGGRLVWTAHDPAPHQMRANAALHKGALGLLWRCYSALLLKMVDGVILLSETHRDGLLEARRQLCSAAFAVIAHPHFKGVYPNSIGRHEARARLELDQDATVLLLLGILRPYKNAEGLITAFRETLDPALRLVIAGDAESAEYAAELTRLAGGDPRIFLHFGFVADDDLQLFLNASDCVVIPFKKATNSGSVALALSFSRPVAVPDIPVFRELSAVVGREWMYLFDGEISAVKLQHILAWIDAERADEPPLETLGWDHIGQQTAEFFRLVKKT